jgi:hypothetical protein
MLQDPGERQEHQEVLGQQGHQEPPVLLEVVDLVDKAVQQVVRGPADPLVSQELLVLQVARDRLGNQEQ